MKNKKAGSHRYAPTDELRESAKIDMCLCNPAIKLPVAALMQPTVSAYSTDTLYKSRSHPSEREPTTNRAKPDSPKILFSGPIQIYQHGFELSIRLEAVDGSSRQRPALPSFYYMASRALASTFTTWQAMHTCMIWYLASRVD